MRGWEAWPVPQRSAREEDNGRKRFFERCLDSRPTAPQRLAVVSCREAPSWRRIGSQEPLEWRLWRENPSTVSHWACEDGL